MVDEFVRAIGGRRDLWNGNQLVQFDWPPFFLMNLAVGRVNGGIVGGLQSHL
jgi:hypothetical protein